MEPTANRAIAIVGLGAVLPDAPNVPAFWNNVKTGRYCISEVSPERWNPALYFDEDHSAPDKTYSKIGGWVREFNWNPMKWRMPIPPRVVDAMDVAQTWAIACTREALEDYGYPKRPLDPDRMAVILGNAMAGEKHYFTALRVYFPEYAVQLSEASSFAALPSDLRAKINDELHARITQRIPDITEDSMPGELANCIAGRIANTFNFHGPNYVVDAACASAMAAFSAATEGLIAGDYDAVITGGIDRNMGASTFVKFCKIGALSATGTRPYAEGADGFVMGEGAAIFLLKRLADAERDGDKIYAVIRGVGGASDGKGKGITAPNPVGQKLAIERGWKKAGLSPATATMMEGHGTSTKVGDVVEVQSMIAVLGETNLPHGSVALGSVKSNIGHLKGAAGAAGMLKAALALHEKVLPPSVNCARKNPDIDFAHSPLYVNTELRPWDVPKDVPRRCGASAFGFGGTNFHVVLEEFIPHRLTGNGKKQVAVTAIPEAASTPAVAYAQAAPVQAPPTAVASATAKLPLRGALVLGAANESELVNRLQEIQRAAAAGNAPAPAAPAESDLRAAERIAIDYADAAELAAKASAALKAFQANQPMMWKALRAQGIFRGKGPAPKVAFLYTGQGSQYVNMLQTLRAAEPIVAETFAEADQIMTPLVGKPLSEFIFADPSDAAAMTKAEDDLRQTAITQPAVIASDIAMTRLLAGYGIEPDMAMGHSVGEYGALVASGALPFEDALEAVSARGREMTRVSMADNGKMAAVFAPIAEVERMLKSINGYVVIANVNSNSQSVIGGGSDAVLQAIEVFQKAGFNVVELPVSHAFHTSIVAPASEPLREMLQRLRLQTPRIPIVANVTGEFYPISHDTVPKMTNTLAQQVAAPVQFVKGLQTLYDAGARVFVEMGPKKALQGFAEDVLGGKGDVLSLFTNHPKVADLTAFNQALCGLYAAGFGGQRTEEKVAVAASVATKVAESVVIPEPVPSNPPEPVPQPVVIAQAAEPAAATPASVRVSAPASGNGDRYTDMGRYFAEVLERGWAMYKGVGSRPAEQPVTITGAALGLPGTEHVFDDANIARLLRGEQFIKQVPQSLRSAMLDKHVTRLVKSDNGGPTFETITDVSDVLKLAGRAGKFDVVKEFGVSEERYAALDRVTSLAIGAGLDALRDAGIPLVLRYKTTSKGTQLPDRWGLPDSLRDETGVVFASAFPGYDAYADEMARYYADKSYREQINTLNELRARIAGNGHAAVAMDIDRMVSQLQKALDEAPYVLDRRFLFRVLSMGHSQFAEFIGARGPNTQVNAACASTTQAVSLAEDWIRAGRCRRVIVLAADDITSDNLIHWFGAGFLASGAAATDDVVEKAALPFDRRRHGMIIGMGAAALVVETPDSARERGIQPIAEVLSAVTANSAFHGTRLDVQHIGQVMESLVASAEKRSGISRRDIAPRTVFVSHETYTPARGGSASAEIFALRNVFGDVADQIVIANTKGFTGHAMAAGVEDVLAIKALESGVVPPVANFKEIDPELGSLNLSKGGKYPVEYALRLGAGFGSQISMTLSRWLPTPNGVRPSPEALGYSYRIVDPDKWHAWLKSVSGQTSPEVEVVNRTLRVRDLRVQTRPAAPVQAVQPEPKQQPVMAKVSAEPAPAVVVGKPAATPVVVVAAPLAAPVPVKPPVDAPAPAVAPKAVSAPVPSAASDDVKQRVLALVAEKTGYPTDMLDLDLDLEADLGVDTVKQAEVFAAIRETYGISRDDNIRLREFPTLAHVINFVYQRRPDLATQAASPAPAETTAPKPEIKPEATTGTTKPASATTVPRGADAVQERILDLAVEKTGYPRDMLDLDLDLEADLGVDTVKQAEMFAAIREIYNIERDENRKLRDYPTLAHVIGFVYEQRPDLKAAVAPTQKPQVEVPDPAPAPTPAPAPPVQAEVPATFPVSAAAGDWVKERILDLAVEKTGYPRDTLDLDLDLEADLGVDTVKQAEMFAAIREIYNIPRDENRKLRDYPTLAHVIGFVYEQRPDLKTAAAAHQTEVAASTPEPTAPEEHPVPVSQPVVATPGAGDSVKERILDLAVEKTGYPRDMLDLELDLEADLGVDTVKQAEMFASIREIYNIPRDENRKMRDYPTLAHVIRFVYEQRPDLKAAVAPTPEPHVEVAALAPVSAPAPAHVEAAVSSLAPEVPAAADSVKERILDLAVEKTGYPRDMLDLELDLEADLGVDTVKQAEMFASIREIYNIPRDENRKMRDYPTLAHVIRFVYEQRPDLVSSKEHATAEADIVQPKAAQVTSVETETTTPAVDIDSIKQTVLAIVAEKTGYPQEMLDLDLDLEADLGVDTVKQAEMFAAVRAAYNIPRDENLKLRDFPTLNHVIQFAIDRRPGAPSQVPAAQLVTAVEAPAPVRRPRPPVAAFDAADRVPRRIPVPSLRPLLNLCKPTGVKLGPGSRVLIMPDRSGVAAQLGERLRAIGVETGLLDESLSPEALTEVVKKWTEQQPVQGVYWLRALDYEGDLDKMTLETWREALRVRVKSLYTVMRALYQQVAVPGTFLITATHLGGQHGYDDSGAVAPLGGAVTGFTKTYKREHTEALVKAVDFEAGRNPAEIAALLIDETLRDPGAVEIGHKDGLRWSIGLKESPVANNQPGITLDEKSVFVITGAAGSIVSAITADLAAASGGTFYLLDVVPQPDPKNLDLARFAADRDGLKRDIFARIQARGERATPALVEKELAALERACAAQNAIDAVHAAGGKARYFSVNLTDAVAVAAAIDEVGREHGHIDVLLHAAGLERSHFLPDKDPREFDLVFDVKSDGWFNLLHAIGNMPLQATVAFSSVAGRFGNAGQSDYSAANDLLCKIASNFRTTRSETRALVIDWTAWGGIGMATRGSIPKMMEMAGISMLAPEAGVPWIRRELTAGGFRGEVVAAERLGVLLSEWDETGGLDVQALETAVAQLPSRGPMIGKVTGMTLNHGLTMETTLDPSSQPFLYDHRIDGTPVLPGVMGIEAFAEAAVCVHPGWFVEAVEEVNFLAPFKFYRDEPRTLLIQAIIAPQGENLVADCRLIGRRTLPNQPKPQETLHFTARVRVTRRPPEAVTGAELHLSTESIVDSARIYRIYFHGPAYQVIDRAWRAGSQIIGQMSQSLPSNHVPSDQPTVAAPRLIELCFQTAGLWEIGNHNRLGLPLHVGEVSWSRAPESAKGPLFAIVTPDETQGSFDADVVDADGNHYVRLSGYRTAALPQNVDGSPLQALQAVTA
jgi:acyl transferase domain-containing protein/acyl carrier protein